jgi:hypothetical protein
MMSDHRTIGIAGSSPKTTEPRRVAMAVGIAVEPAVGEGSR